MTGCDHLTVYHRALTARTRVAAHTLFSTVFYRFAVSQTSAHLHLAPARAMSLYGLLLLTVASCILYNVDALKFVNLHPSIIGFTSDSRPMFTNAPLSRLSFRRLCLTLLFLQRAIPGAPPSSLLRADKSCTSVRSLFDQSNLHSSSQHSPRFACLRHSKREQRGCRLRDRHRRRNTSGQCRVN